MVNTYVKLSQRASDNLAKKFSQVSACRRTVVAIELHELKWITECRKKVHGNNVHGKNVHGKMVHGK